MRKKLELSDVFCIGDRVFSRRFHCGGIVTAIGDDGRSVTVAHDCSIKKGWWIPGDPRNQTCGYVYTSCDDLQNLSAKYKPVDDCTLSEIL